MIGPLTYLDLGLLAVAFISGLLAMYRGFSREILSILSWVVAALAVLYFVINHKKFAEEMAQQMGVPNPVIAQIAIGAVIFLIVLVVVHLITARISDSILDSQVGMIDRILGFGFGVIRGFVIVLIPFMFYEAYFADPKLQYPWVRNALSHNILSNSGKAIQPTLLWLADKLQSKQRGEQQSFMNHQQFSRARLASGRGFHISGMSEPPPSRPG